MDASPNIKNTWKGIKSLISLKSIASRASTVLSRDNGNTITDLYDLANAFNNYFASIAETTKNNIKYSNTLNIFQIILRNNVIVQYF